MALHSAPVIRAFNNVLEGQSRATVLAGLYLLVGVIGGLDYVTGYEISFSIFYLAPVGLAAWFLDKSAGILLSTVGAAVWLTVDVSSGHQYSHPAIPVWNAVSRFGFFLITAFLLAEVHSLLRVRSLLAERDSLTTLLNSGAFTSKCDVVFQLAGRNHQQTTLGYVDLDQFKAINDTLGHRVGDLVLKSVSAAIRDRVRGADAVGRMGGDEFAILLPQTDLAGAKTFFSEVRQSLLQLAVENHWPLGFSIGVVIFNPPPPSPARALEIADQQMYEVKRSSKNDIRFLEWADPEQGA